MLHSSPFDTEVEPPSLSSMRPVLQRTAVPHVPSSPAIDISVSVTWQERLSWVQGKAPSWGVALVLPAALHVWSVLRFRRRSLRCSSHSPSKKQHLMSLTWALQVQFTCVSARVRVACVWGWGWRGGGRRVWGGATGTEAWRLRVWLCCRFLCCTRKWRNVNSKSYSTEI